MYKNKSNLSSSTAEGIAQLQSVYIEHARPRTKQNFIPEVKHKPTQLHWWIIANIYRSISNNLPHTLPDKKGFLPHETSFL